MAIMVPDVGAAAILEEYFNQGANLTCKLFVTDVTPTQASVAGDFTIATGGGYVDKTLTNGSWTIAQDGSAIDTASYAQQVWTFTGALTTNGTIYGYIVVDGAGTLIFADKATTAFTPTANGDVFAVTINFKLSSGTPA